MLTPVSVARQCLTEEAARALDNAVAVARRRCHAQTTSLHAVSALLALPPSSFRDACSRARTSAYSPRLHFRALELSVGVSLDRLPSSKDVQEPPVSNSLMAAIKRSQANQRRHPENFHFHQLHIQQQAASQLKVELKHFILSILDDPIVSRVLGDAGFLSYDVKLAIMHPPISQSSRFSRTRYPPIFLCNMTDSDPGSRSFTFPFPGCFAGEDDDGNCRRITEILVRKTNRNPLLMGVCAAVALQNFTDCVQKVKSGVFLAQLSGMSIICICKEISEFLKGIGSEEKLALKFEEVAIQLEKFPGPGIAVNYGELVALVDDDLPGATVSLVVSKLTDLMKLHRTKLWLVGAAATYETYAKFLARFPAIEKDWDLHLLPITSSKSSFEGFGSKSSLMGSFVPFGGFFSTPTDFKSPISSPNQSFVRCHKCTEKYEQEISTIWKIGSSVSASDQPSQTLPVWLQMAELDTRNEGMSHSKTKVDEIPLSAETLRFQKKWNDICRALHHEQPSNQPQTLRTSEIESVEVIPTPSDTEGSGGNSFLDGPHSVSPLSSELEKNFLLKQNIEISAASVAQDNVSEPAISLKLSKNQVVEVERSSIFPFAGANTALPCIHESSPSLPVITTDLGLGTIYAATSRKHKGFELNCNEDIGGFSFHSGLRDFKSLKNVLTQKVGWQDDAISAISEAVLLCRSGRRRHCSSIIRGDIWLTFLGPDKVGKKKIALALAEVLFGSRESIISVDLGYQDCVQQSGSLFESEALDGYNVKFRGTLVVDYVAGELSKKPHSVVYLENIDKADPLVQNSLSQAIKTGKFPDSRGREISINNMTIVVTSTISKGDQTFQAERKAIDFPEEKILAARNCQMQILYSCGMKDSSQITSTSVRIAMIKEVTNHSSLRKRKHIDSVEGREEERSCEKMKGIVKRTPMSYLDLNLPVEDIGEEISDGDSDSDSVSEGSETWLEDFLNQVDEKVVFKPYNFEANADKLMKEIKLQVEKVFSCEMSLEIDYGVMVQILAADWLSEKKETTEAWIDEVLGRSLVEAQQKYHSLAHPDPVMKLSNSERRVEEQAPGTCLPARINLS